MVTKFNVGDEVLVDGIIEFIYVETADNEPVYHVRIKAGGQEAYRMRLAEDVINARQNRYVKGTCATCIHRDPEDKKCDCGAMERQGCQFPVSDDYFCKFYEKNENETS